MSVTAAKPAVSLEDEDGNQTGVRVNPLAVEQIEIADLLRELLIEMRRVRVGIEIMIGQTID